jgi:transcription termination/antitermination protein NusG
MMAATRMATLENVSRPLWFAVGVKPRHEKAVSLAFELGGLEYFVPLYRERRVWSDRIKVVELPLFAGYVFCRFRYHERLRILRVSGVHSIIGGGKIFQPIADEQIATLKRLTDSGMARPCPYLVPGQMVQLVRGPLCGVRGTVVQAKGTTSVIVSLEILQRSVAVEVNADAVFPERPVKVPVAPSVQAICARL